MLRPSERWYWTYCPTKDRLLLDISDDAQFCSPFAASQLISQPAQQALSMAEAEMFWAIDDSLQTLALPPEVRLEICLMALSSAFVLPQGHKSWYFQAYNEYCPKAFELVQLSGNTSQYALVIAPEGQSSSCLLLGEVDTLAGKTLPRLQLLRLLNNRLLPLQQSAQYRQSA